MAGYIAAIINENNIKKIQTVVNDICSEDDYYYSDVVGHIQGNVTDKLHLTLYYGLGEVNQEELQKYIDTIELDTLKLGDLKISSGYQVLYKLITIEVLDKDKKLDKISRSFREFDNETEWQYEIRPHLTLAYVKPGFELANKPILPETVKVQTIKYFN